MTTVQTSVGGLGEMFNNLLSNAINMFSRGAPNDPWDT